jgi:hypothetical protein
MCKLCICQHLKATSQAYPCFTFASTSYLISKNISNPWYLFASYTQALLSILLYHPLSVLIPAGITCDKINAATLLIVDGVDVGAKLAELEAKVNLLNGRVSAF